MEISLIIPCYNEEENIVTLYKELSNKLKSYEYEIIFVDDGSKDKTLSILKQLREQTDKNIQYLSFTRNFGHQNALRAGIEFAEGKCIISMDADLQHPPYLIPKLIEKWKEGFDIVYTQRGNEKKQKLFKKITSRYFYKIMNIISDTRFEEGTADFRLLDRKVIEIIKQSTETDLFLRGFIFWTGFKHHKILYNPEPRFAGKTKYTLKRMIQFALNGITSFSIRPLRFSIYLGLFVALLAFIYTCYVITLNIFSDKAITGWSSLIITVLLLGGFQLIFMGVLGEYLGRVFQQAKNRPDYIIQENSKKNIP